MGRMFGWLMVAVLAGALAGCKPSDAIKQGKVIDNGTKTEERAATPSAPLDPATLGEVSGTSSFFGEGSGPGEDRYEPGPGVLDDGWG